VNEQDLIRYFEERRGDTTNWSQKPVVTDVPKMASVVFSLRLPAQELDDLRQRAEADGTTVSDLIRWAVSSSINRPQRNPTLTLNRFFQGEGSQRVGNFYAVSVGFDTRHSTTDGSFDEGPTNARISIQPELRIVS
jgi:hypothetical protein